MKYVQLADDFQCSAIQIVPENQECHLQLNAKRLKHHDEVRVDIYAYFESCTGKIVIPRTREVASKAGSGDGPTDVDSLVKGRHHGKGIGKGDGKQLSNKGQGSKQSKV